MQQWCAEVRRKCEKRGASSKCRILYISGDHSLSHFLDKGAKHWMRHAAEAGQESKSGGVIKRWRREGRIGLHELDGIKEAAERLRGEAEEEEKTYAAKRAKAFRAWAKRATDGMCEWRI